MSWMREPMVPWTRLSWELIWDNNETVSGPAAKVKLRGVMMTSTPNKHDAIDRFIV